MPAVQQRQVGRRRSARARRIKPEVAAIQALLGPPGPAAEMQRIVAERESAFHESLPALSPRAVRLRSRWSREGRAISRQFFDVVTKWDRGWGTLPDFHFPARELLHVYSPDRTGAGGEFFYAFEWTSVDPFVGTSAYAHADRRTGLMDAGHYTTNGWMRAHAGVGVSIVPKTGIGKLRIAPYVQWSGNDLLQHRVFDPQLGEQRWGVAIGRVGIIMQSRLITGGDFRTDLNQWQDVWHRAQVNPQSPADYEGTASSATSLVADEVPVTSGRRYTIWVACAVKAFADSGFAVATRTTVAMRCAVPFLVIEEKPA